MTGRDSRLLQVALLCSLAALGSTVVSAYGAIICTGKLTDTDGSQMKVQIIIESTYKGIADFYFNYGKGFRPEARKYFRSDNDYFHFGPLSAFVNRTSSYVNRHTGEAYVQGPGGTFHGVCNPIP
jgi:hypothetical protein